MSAPEASHKRIKAHPKHKAHEEEAAEGWLVSYADMMTLLVGFFVILLSFSKTDEEKLDEAIKYTAKEFGGVYQVPYADIADKIKATLEKQGFGSQFSIKQSSAGITISFLGASFFDSGSAEVKTTATELMQKLVPLLKNETKDFQVVVEGHTDDVPVVNKTQYHTNWELSGIRASRVLEFFEGFGYEKKQLTAVGYGESRPLVPNRDANGVANPINQAQNRRVVLKILKKSENMIGKEDATPVPVATPPGESGHP